MLLFCASLFLFAMQAVGQHPTACVFSERCQQAYSATSKIKFEEAAAILKQARALEPNNAAVPWMEASLSFAQAALADDKAVYTAFVKQAEAAREQCANAPSSAFATYARADLYLKEGLLAARYEEYLTAMGNMRHAYNYAKDSQDADPNFSGNLLLMGTLHLIAGSIPDSYKWLSYALGVSGTVADGEAEFRKLLGRTDPLSRLFQGQAAGILAFTALGVDEKKDEAYKTLAHRSLSGKDDLFASTVKAALSIAANDNVAALAALRARPRGKGYPSIALLGYFDARCQLNKLSADTAALYFQNYIRQAKSKALISDAYLFTAHCQTLQGNTQSYGLWFEKYKATMKDKKRDKILLDLEAGYARPQALCLLKARFLVDGGNGARARSMLSACSSTDFNKREQIEWNYRMARSFDVDEQGANAERYYLKCIELGKNYAYHFAAASALQLGEYYFKLGRNDAAKAQFAAVKNMTTHPYVDEYNRRVNAELAKMK